MDPRVHAHAELLVDHCTAVEAGDDVSIWAPVEAEDLVVALHEKLGERDANPFLIWDSPRATRAYLRAADPERFTEATHSLAQMEASDVVIVVEAHSNAHELGDVDPDTRAARSRVNKAHMEAYLETRWVGTQFPAPGDAQTAGMSTEAYEEFVYAAIDKDWDAQRDFQQRLVDRLEPANEVRLVSRGTDLTMSVAGMHAVNDDGRKNLPGGEVFTVPVSDSVEGEVSFDRPAMIQGREVEDAWLRFEDGIVVDHAAAKNETALTALLDTDDGARRLGELGIGMNRDIDRFTRNILFDEKMGDTVHLALGRSIDEGVGDGREANDSAVHVDMVVDVSEASSMELDGETVQRNGRFVFEDGFE